MSVVSFRRHLEAAFSYYQEQELDKKRKRKRTSEGDRRLLALRKTLDSFHFTRSPMQRSFHEEFISACLPKIYEDDGSVDFSEIQKRENFRSLKQCCVAR
jgi:hypothetical protein